MIAIIAAGLAGWRLASLLIDEDGPWDMFLRLRLFAGVPSGRTASESQVRRIGGLFLCIWCMSVWTTAAAWLCWEYVAVWPVAILAAAGVALLAEATKRLS